MVARGEEDLFLKGKVASLNQEFENDERKKRYPVSLDLKNLYCYIVHTTQSNLPIQHIPIKIPKAFSTEIEKS